MVAAENRIVSSSRTRKDATSERKLTDSMSDSENCLFLHLSDDLLDHLVRKVIHAGERRRERRRQVDWSEARGS